MPLGLDVVRRDLGPDADARRERGLPRQHPGRRSTTRTRRSAYALQFGRGLDAARGRKFVHMYVNELTLDMGETGRRALEPLYARAVAVGAIEKAPAIEIV